MAKKIDINKNVSLNKKQKTLQTLNREAEEFARTRKKEISKIDHKFPQAEVYVVEEANSSGSYNVVKESLRTLYNSATNMPGFNEVAENLYDDPSASSEVAHRLMHVTSILPSTPLVKGDKVEVGFYNRSRQKPYIRRLLSRGIFSESSGSNDFPIVPLVPGLWIQAFGFWWSPKYNEIQLNNQLELEVPEFEEVIGANIVTYTPEPSTLELHFPSVARGSEPGQLYKDGIAFMASWPPWPWGTQISTGPRPDLGINVNHTVIILANVYPPETVWTADYFEDNDYYNAAQVHQMSGFTENQYLNEAFGFYGICAFPSDNGNVIASLSPVYEVSGESEVPTIISEDFTFTETTETLTLQENPWIEEESLPPNIQTHNIVLANYIAGLYTGYAYFIAPNQIMYPYQPDTEVVDIYYLYETTTVETNKYESMIATEGQFEFYTQANQGPDYLWFAGSIGDVLGPSAKILALNGVWVNGTPDPLATFAGDKVILSSAASAGDTIEFEHDVVHLNQNYDSRSSLDYAYAEFAWNTTYVPYQILNADVAGVSVLNNIRERPGFSQFRIVAVFEPGDELSVEYTYIQVLGGTTIEITALNITETSNEGTIVLSTPLDPPWRANSPAWYDPADTEFSSWGYSYTAPNSQLFYDPGIGGYTINGPTGLIWRSRKELGAPATSPPTPASLFTLSEWPEEALSRVQPEDPTYATPRVRNLPWMCVSVCGSRAIQAGWRTVTDPYEAYNINIPENQEHDFKIRLWQRDSDSYEWFPITEVSVRDFIEPDGEGTLVIEDCNLNEYSQFQDFPTHMAKDQSAWILVVRWKVVPETEYFYNIIKTFGFTDCGLTFVAINPNTGAVLNRFTIKSNAEEVIQVFEDTSEIYEDVPDLTQVNIAIDKYVNDNPIYYPPLSGSTPAQPYLGGIMWAAVPNRFALYGDGSANPWFILSYVRSVGEEVSVNKYRPDPPRIQNDVFFEYVNNNKNNFTMDEDGNIYFYMTMPVWYEHQRQTTTRLHTTEVTVGTWSIPEQAAGTSESNTVPPASSYLTSVPLNNEEGDRIFAERVTKVLYNEVETSFFYPPTITGTAELLRRVLVSRGTPVVTGFDPETGRYSWSFPAVTYTTYSERPVLNTDFAAELEESYPGAGPFDFPTFEGFQLSPMPTSGLQVYSTTSRWAHKYFQTSKVFLVKLNWDGESFTQKWAKEVTYYGDFQDNNYETISGTHPKGPTLRSILKAGRVLFGLTNRHTVIPPTSSTTTRMYVEIYPDGDTEPEMLHAIEIPNSSSGTIDKAIVGVDDQGREYITIWHRPSQYYVTTIYMNENISETPVVTQLDPTTNNNNNQFVPTGQEKITHIAQVNNRYYWQDKTKIYYKNAKVSGV